MDNIELKPSEKATLLACIRYVKGLLNVTSLSKRFRLSLKSMKARAGEGYFHVDKTGLGD